MDQGHTVTATFVPEYLVTVTLTGSGSVTSADSTIACPGTTCSASYLQGSSITLTAQADPTFVFIGWSGASCSGTSDCTITMDQAHTVTATFVPEYLLTVTLTGNGSVTIADCIIACPGTTCSASYFTGISITLTAHADLALAFPAWSWDR